MYRHVNQDYFLQLYLDFSLTNNVSKNSSQSIKDTQQILETILIDKSISIDW